MKLKFSILEPSSHRVDTIRKTFSSRMEKLYNGWSDEFDKQWDNHSFLILLEDLDAENEDSRYQATCRVVIKRFNTVEFSTPMEHADILNFNLSEKFKNCCEGSMVSFKSVKAFHNMMYYLCSWVMDNNLDHVITCYDVNNPLFKRLHNGTGFWEIDDAFLIYSGFYSKKTDQLVKWQVVDGDLNARGNLVKEKLFENLAPVECDYDNLPNIEQWVKTYSQKQKANLTSTL